MPPPRPGDHYFTSDPAAPSAEREVELALPDMTLRLRTDRGTFSAERVDAGTKLLLAEGARPDPGARHLLDLGCGWGSMAVVLARRAPQATVWAVDVNERAVALCRANAEAAGCTNVRALLVPTDDPLAGIPEDVAVDGIWSNPPIRVGKAALHDLLTAALGRLAPEGSAHLVVQKHLGADSLQRWLQARGWACERRASRAGYRLLDVTGAGATAPDGTPAGGSEAEA